MDAAADISRVLPCYRLVVSTLSVLFSDGVDDNDDANVTDTKHNLLL